MKGYIYISGTGTDPSARKNMNDPILFSKTPTLGGCMPNIRRVVLPGDFIFVVSGMVSAIQQYVVGGMQVAEQIDALAAYERFPENRLQLGPSGLVEGNVIVDANGNQHPLDDHDPETFEARIKNFIVGTNPVALETEREVAMGREQTLPKLSALLNKRGNRVVDVMSRWAKLNENQVQDMLSWLQGIKASAALSRS
jgi:hypothetical protein